MVAAARATALVIAVTMTIQAIAHALLVRFVGWLLSVGNACPTFWHDVTVTIGIHLILLTALLGQVAVWAAGFLLCGTLPDYATAFDHSAVNFTTPGYGDIEMPSGWRLLGPLEAANGLLMFGLSASSMFAVTNRLVELRLQRQELGPRP
jgi:hypothetical protein